MSNHVYRFLNKEQEIIYVGKTRKSITTRINAHFNNGHLKEKLEEVDKIEYLKFKSRLEMDLAEIYLINLWEPKLNTTHKHEEHISFHPFNINDFDWLPFDEYELERIRNRDRTFEGDVDFTTYLTEENSLLNYMLNECFNGDMFSYREFYSEYEYAESVLREGFYLKPSEIDLNRIIWLFDLLAKHQQGKTSKVHNIEGEALDYELQK